MSDDPSTGGSERLPDEYEVVESEGTDGMAYFLCSECEEPVVEFGEIPDSHWFSHRECGCPDGSPEHGWRMLQDYEIHSLETSNSDRRGDPRDE